MRFLFLDARWMSLVLVALLAGKGLGQEAKVLAGHEGWVSSLAFSSKEPLLATGSADKTIKLWSLPGKGAPHTLTSHSDTVAAVAFSPNGKLLASGSYDQTALLWNVETRKKQKTFKGHKGAVLTVAFSPDGKILATGDMDGKVHLWDVADGNKMETLTGHTTWVNAIVFSSEGILATGSSDNTVRTWKKFNDRWQLQAAYPMPFGEVRSLAFAPDGKTLAVGVRYGHLVIIDFATTRLISKKAHASDIWSLAFSPNGTTLATGNGDWDQPGDIRLWNTATWKETKAFKHSGEVLCLGFSPDGKTLAAGSWDKSVRLWSLAENAKLETPRFHLTFGPEITPRPFTGRVFLLTSKNPSGDLPQRPKWFNPEPFFAQDVKDWQPGDSLVFGPDALGCPQPLAKLVPGKYAVQAVMDLDRGGQSSITSPGNGYSKPVSVDIGFIKNGPIALHIDQIYPDKRFTEKEHVKLVDIESKPLSNFHGKPIRLRAGVVLPKSFFQEKDRHYPVIYEIPGFGGDHFGAFAAETRKATDVAGVEMLYVVLDPACRTGHHVFADSANNGPYGQALIEELIPHLEAKFRGLGRPEGRFLTGHSSGGWSSLWLQVTYPDFFAGTWSTGPDPVDFRDFQKVNIYDKANNLFFDGQGEQRPLARKGGKVSLYYKPFSDMEVVMGRGGQLFSFEAVFSPRGPDGQPQKLWDRQTGAIDPDVANSWQQYDIRRILEKNWMTLGPKLAGKIHVYMGSEDTFYLEGATILLQKSLKEMGSGAVVEIFAGKDHGNLLDSNLRGRIGREMAEVYRKER
jgi:hypothetical protein